MRMSPAVVRDSLLDIMEEEELDLLRAGAAPRYLTSALAARLTGSDAAAKELLANSLVSKRTDSGGADVWVMRDYLRPALLEDHADADRLWQQVASSGDDAVYLDPLYATLAAASTRERGIGELRSRFEKALEAADVAAAHDLLALLDEWPLSGGAVDNRIVTLRQELQPELRRYSRSARERDETRRYFTRPFESALYERFLDPGAEQWMMALHAAGGRGKTMFLKNLLGRHCPENGVPVARIDFDYVADQSLYTREPWRLLLAIADQLNPQLPHDPFNYLLEANAPYKARLYNEALARRAAPHSTSTRPDDRALEAAQLSPRRFRTELASAVGDGIVLVAIDTVENVLHAPDSTLAPLLEALGDVRNGVEDQGSARVPGLRVLVSGRFDLTGDRDLGGGATVERSPGFRSMWMGEGSLTKLRLGDDPEVETVLDIGSQALSLELPEFSRTEARSFLVDEWHVPDGELVDVIVDRCHDNPMKLALLAEHALRFGLTADLLREYESVELVYLIDRVVDRIADGRVQWLLRWGSLVQTLTKEAVEQVIWPALVEFSKSAEADPDDSPESGVQRYDDTTKDGLHESRHQIARWEIPAHDVVTAPGALDGAWSTLLDYASGSSWVSLDRGADDAVFFHNEIRMPLRRLLFEKQHPAFDDIHRRALRFWHECIERGGAGRRIALRNAVFHAYQPFVETDRADPNVLWQSLLDQRCDTRDERAAIASAVAEIASSVAELSSTEDAYYLPPAPSVVAAAHLELAEAAIAERMQSDTGNYQNALVTQLAALDAADEDLADANGHRVEFVRAASDVAQGKDAVGWDRLATVAAADLSEHEKELIAQWAQHQSVPRLQLDVGRQLVDAMGESPHVALVGESLARGLIDAELWTEALNVATMADHADLMAEAALPLGLARFVGDTLFCSPRFKAEAALQRYEPRQALFELGQGQKVVPELSDDAAIVQGEAYAMLGDVEQATHWVGTASTQTSIGTTTKASFALGKMLRKSGDVQSAASALSGLVDSADPLVRLRALLEQIKASLSADGDFDAMLLAEAHQVSTEIGWLPPSIDVDLAVVALAAKGPFGDDVEPEELDRLAESLERVDAPSARLLRLQELDEVGRASFAAPWTIERLRSLTELPDDVDMTPALAFAQVELDRVLGDLDSAQRRLDQIGGLGQAESEVLQGAITAASRRISLARAMETMSGSDDAEANGPIAAGDAGYDEGEDFDIESPPANDSFPVELTIESDRSGGIVVELPVRASDAHEFSGSTTIELGRQKQASFALSEARAETLAKLGQGIFSEFFEVSTMRTSSTVLRLHLGDATVAQWPWELATDSGYPLLQAPGVGVVVRHRQNPLRDLPTELRSPGIHVELACALDSEQQYIRTPDYGEFAVGPKFRSTSTGTGGPLSTLDDSVTAVHVVCEPVMHPVPSLRINPDLVIEARTLAYLLGEVPRLVVLDLVLERSDGIAAEQLMAANALCWELHRARPEVRLLCGVFDEDGERQGRRALLMAALSDGRPLEDLLKELQHQSIGVDDPLRTVVSLNADSSDLRLYLDDGPTS